MLTPCWACCAVRKCMPCAWVIQQVKDRSSAAWVLYELAMLCREEGDFQQAGVYAQDALQLFREVGDANGEAWMQMVIGEVSRGYGRYYEALGHLHPGFT